MGLLKILQILAFIVVFKAIALTRFSFYSKLSFYLAPPPKNYGHTAS